MMAKELQQLFGEVIREAREERGVSQEELAAQAGLHRTYISLLERGMRNPSLTVITRLADALNQPAAKIVAACEERANRKAKDRNGGTAHTIKR